MKFYRIRLTAIENERKINPQIIIGAQNDTCAIMLAKQYYWDCEDVNLVRCEEINPTSVYVSRANFGPI